MDNNFPLNTTDNNPDPSAIKPNDNTGGNLLPQANDLQENDLQEQINKEILSPTEPIKPVEDLNSSPPPSQTIPTPIIPPVPPPNFSSGDLPKKSGGKNIFALAGVFVLLLILIPTIIFFGVKRQQSTTGRATDDPKCWQPGGKTSYCTELINPPNPDAESTCYSRAGSDCRWETTGNQRWIGNCYCKIPEPPTPTPTQGERTGNCPGGKQPGLGGKTNPDPNCETKNGGVYCYDNSKAYCCYNQDGVGPIYEYCAEGQQGSCEDKGNGSICVKNGWSGEIFKLTGDNVSCPYSSSNKQTIFNGVVNGTDSCSFGQGEIFSLNGGCGQIDGPCGSCKPGCNTTQPTPTPTTIQQTGQCQAVKIYNANNQIITDLTTIRSGQVVNLAVLGSSSGFDRGRFRVNNGVWLPSADGTVQTNQNNEFFYEYTVPAGINNFEIEAMVHHASLGWK